MLVQLLPVRLSVCLGGGWGGARIVGKGSGAPCFLAEVNEPPGAGPYGEGLEEAAACYSLPDTTVSSVRHWPSAFYWASE